MPWLGHGHALAGASGPSLIFSSLLLSCLYRNRGLVGTVRSDSLSNVQTTSFRHRLLPPSFATNASIAVSTHSRLTNGLWSVMRFGSRCEKGRARQGPG